MLDPDERVARKRIEMVEETGKRTHRNGQRHAQQHARDDDLREQGHTPLLVPSSLPGSPFFSSCPSKESKTDGAVTCRVRDHGWEDLMSATAQAQCSGSHTENPCWPRCAKRAPPTHTMLLPAFFPLLQARDIMLGSKSALHAKPPLRHPSRSSGPFSSPCRFPRPTGSP